jgi:hypothetical protein
MASSENLYQPKGPITTEVTIANGATVSGAADLKGTRLVGVGLPASLTSTAMTIQGSIDGTNYALINLPGGALSLTVASSRFVGLTADMQAALRGFRYIKVVGGSAESGAKIITLVSMPV